MQREYGDLQLPACRRNERVLTYIMKGALYIQMGIDIVRYNPAPSNSEIVVLYTGEQETDPLHRYVQVNLDHVLVHFVTEGKGRFFSDAGVYELTSGDSFFIFPDEIAGYISDELQPWTYMWLALRGSYVKALLSEIGISSSSPISRTARIPELTSRYRKIYQAFERGRLSCDMEAGGLARILLAHYMDDQLGNSASNSKPMIHQQIDQLVRWMNTSYMEPLSIEAMAAQLGYHRTYLARMFHQYMGVSPMQYLTALRLERAAILLQSSQSFTVEEIASLVGYKDPLYFSKLFKQKYGLSPSIYKKQ